MKDSEVKLSSASKINARIFHMVKLHFNWLKQTLTAKTLRLKIKRSTWDNWFAEARLSSFCNSEIAKYWGWRDRMEVGCLPCT